MIKKIVILGSTGSIGTQALDVLRGLPGESFVVEGLSAYSNAGLLREQILEFRPKIAAVWSETDALATRKWLQKRGIRTKVVWGLEGLIKAAEWQSANFVLSSVVGSIGIKPLIAAIKKKKQVALANKEALVVAGRILMELAGKNRIDLIPVDSEHSAIFQCLKNEDRRTVKKIILTASGGPFYKKSGSKSRRITVREALSHPTWRMGKKITIDSATLMNKGLEAIEASWLFGVPLKNIEIVIHPQSIVHSMVEFADGSVLAQMSNPDMRLPIQYALTYPGRTASRVKELSLTKIGHLDFAKPDFSRFPCLKLALKAGDSGGTAPAVMNAANEIAVNAFLQNRISFDKIASVVEKTMKSCGLKRSPSLEQILEADAAARKEAEGFIRSSVNSVRGRIQ